MEWTTLADLLVWIFTWFSTLFLLYGIALVLDASVWKDPPAAAADPAPPAQATATREQPVASSTESA
jgi:hypothetical protein